MNNTKGHTNVRGRPKYIGTHLICEFFDCRGNLDSERLAKKALVLAVKKLGAQLLCVKTHKFSPRGLTAFALLAESHISIHTWPEHNFMALDIFTCSKRMKPKESLRVFRKLYKPGEVKVIDIKRGTNHGLILKGDWHADKAVPGVEYLSDRVRGFIKIKKRIFETKSPFQQIEVVDTYNLGRALILDGILQTTEKDEFIYHETLVHPAMLTQTKPQNILIIGGGDGGSLREVLRYGGVERAYLCEIDAEVVDTCKKFLPNINRGVFNDSRAEIVFEDGAEFIKGFSNFFDAVIVDSSDPIGPATILFSEKFYESVSKALTKNGVFSIHAGMNSPLQTKTLHKAVTALKKIYPFVEVRTAYVPSYFGSMNFVLSAKHKKAISYFGPDFRRISQSLKYYSPELHYSSRILPKFLKRVVDPQ